MKNLSMVIAGILCLAFMGGMAVALNPLDNDDWDQDPDMDGLNNREEFSAGSDPNNWDSDGDGLPDGWEMENLMDPTDPTDAELDNDYYGGEEYSTYSQVDPPYTNYAEYYRLYGIDAETGENLYRATNPNDEDTDGDSLRHAPDILQRPRTPAGQEAETSVEPEVDALRRHEIDYQRDDEADDGPDDSSPRQHDRFPLCLSSPTSRSASPIESPHEGERQGQCRHPGTRRQGDYSHGRSGCQGRPRRQDVRAARPPASAGTNVARDGYEATTSSSSSPS